MESYSIEEYYDAGCPEYQKPDRIAISLYIFMRGRICDTGCSRFNFGACPAYKKMTKKKKEEWVPKRVLPVYDETVRHEAKRRQISIGQVRRERNAEANKEVSDDK